MFDEGQEMKKNLCCDWEEYFLETKQVAHKMILNKILSEESPHPPSHLLFLDLCEFSGSLNEALPYRFEMKRNTGFQAK